MAYRTRGSVIGPLFLIGLGVLLLLRHHFSFSLLDLAARYWPVLLIIWGVSKLVEYYSAPAGGYVSRFTGGDVVLVVLIVIGGMMLSAASRFRHSEAARDMGIEWGDWDVFGSTFNFQAQTSAPLAAHAPVLVRAYRGDLDVEASTSPAISVSDRAEVTAGSQQEAQRLFDETKPVIRQENGNYVVLATGDRQEERVHSHLSITLPAGSPLTLETHHGDEQVSGWNANLNLTSDRGDVAATNIRGSLRVVAHHASIRIEKVTGSVDIDGGGEDVTVDSVSGPVTVRGEFSGTIHAARLPEGFHFTSSRTDLRVASVPQDLTTDMQDMRIDGANDVRVETRDKDINIANFSGPLYVRNAHGGINLRAAKRLGAAVDVSTRDGDITLSLPPDASFSLDAVAHRGSINSDFPVKVQQSGDTSEAHSTVGSTGPKLTLETSDSSISLQKSGAHANTEKPPSNTPTSEL
jgi:hypothetical protein